MTPKEKAKERMDSYYNLFAVELENSIDYREAKKCALHEVNEILDGLINNASSLKSNPVPKIKYYWKVKQELEKL